MPRDYSLPRPYKTEEGVCPECGKPWQFTSQGGRPRAYCCKKCYNKHYHRTHEGASSKRRRLYYERYPDKKRLYKERQIAKTYGLSLDEYEVLLKKANHCCEACGRTPNKKRLAIDHCHDSERLRGVLCDQCNLALGLLGDGPEGVKQLLDYAERVC